VYAEVKSSLRMNGKAGAGPRIVTLSMDGVTGHLHTPAILSLGKEPWVPTEQGTGLALHPVCRLSRREKFMSGGYLKVVWCEGAFRGSGFGRCRVKANV
jgi:hypothetical protein